MFKVHIELQRVQTWLFAMPQLRAMIGANVLLGETLRLELRKLLLENPKGAWKPHPVEGFPSADKTDPLETLRESGGTSGIQDNPAEDAKHGILARDGGHFVAVFKEEAHAKAFEKAAANCLREKVPGLRFSCKAEKIVEGKENHEHTQRPAQPFLSIELPVFARCDWAGRGLASTQVKPGNDDADLADVSLDAEARSEAGGRADKGTANDLVTRMNWLALRRTNVGSKRRLANTFEELADGRYLAVIHADGNGVGKRAKELAEKSKKLQTSWLKAEAEQARFFHDNRVLLRKALVSAIQKTAKFPPCKNRSTDQHGKPRDPDREVSPFLPLMLGGDDLLVACRADLAMPFVQALCEALEREQKDRADFRLTLGIGVAIASYSMPFHQLHAVAEACASSAKRKTRKDSAIDWAVYTASWAEKDLAEVRRRDWVFDNGKRILSQRPMCVLASTKEPSLEELLRQTRELTSASRTSGPTVHTSDQDSRQTKELASAPRTQLHYLKEQLSAGEHLAALAFEELSAEAKAGFTRAGIQEVWRPLAGTDAKTTCLLDLIELDELRRLGKKSPPNTTTDEVQR